MMANRSANGTAMMAKKRADTVQRLLSSTHHHIEFNGYLTNHAKHAVVALQGLNASEEVIQGYFDEYTRLTPYGLSLVPAEPPSNRTLSPDNWQDLLGKKQGFQDLHLFFDQQEQVLGTDGLIQKYAPELLSGCAGALTHGVIHLGWGLDAGNRGMTVEGLAYLAYTFLPSHPSRFQHAAHPDPSPIASLLRAANAYTTENFADFASNLTVSSAKYSLEAGFHPELHEAGFQWRLAAILEEGHSLFLQLPTWLDELPVDTAIEQMYKAVSVLYLVSAGEPGDRSGGYGNFVILHLLTALWGAEQVVARLTVEQQRRGALKYYWVAAMAIAASTASGLPSRDKLEETWAKYDCQVWPEGCQDVRGWEEIVERAYKEEEEHNIKLVYVAKEVSARYGGWKGFQAAADSFCKTPNVGPGREKFSA